MASTRDYVTVRNDYGQESKENEHEDEKSDKFDNSSSLIKVTCSDQGMEVAVPKGFFQVGCSVLLCCVMPKLLYLNFLTPKLILS